MSRDKVLPDKLERRRFLASAGAAVGVGVAGAALAPVRAVAATHVPRKWDDTVDVIVIGTGFAGLSAAVEARTAGAQVLVLEKMAVHGGNSIINGGDFAAAGTAEQAALGIQDTPDLMLADMLKAGGSLNHPDLARMVAYGSKDALEWTQQVIGAKYVRVNFHGGHSVKRSHQCVNGSGGELVNKLLAKAQSLGARIEMRTKVLRLVRGEDGRLEGLEVRRGYLFPNESSGEVAYIRARRGVVLASGGFSQDVRLRQVHDPRLVEKFESTNHPGATGEVLLAACQVGAMDVQMDWIQLGPWTSPDEPGFGQTPQFCERLVGYGLMVDPKSGKRFFKETGNRKERADAIIRLGHPAVIIGDAEAVARTVLPKTLEKAIEYGAVRKFETLDELARAYEMPVEAFREQVARWNGFVEKKKDDDLDCMIFKDATATAKAPYYAARLWPRVHHTMGGLVIDRDARVIGFDFQPIAGLYACGEVAGGVHGAVRLGSVAMTDCVVFGRIAGRNAAQHVAAT